MSDTNGLRELEKLGQSVWLDDIGRVLLDNGDLERLVRSDGVSGLTSNPAIFAASIMKEPQYATAVDAQLPKVGSAAALYEALVLEDLQRAADLLAPVFRASGGLDGLVSLEVSPHLANDTAGTAADARRLWAALARPNALIKIPGTVAGLGAIRDTIAAGIGVNVTLLFSAERYRAVLEAHTLGLERRVASGAAVSGVNSVASFFVSRIDSAVDKRLDDLASKGAEDARALRGEAAIASACAAFEVYQDWLRSPRWQALAVRGASPQRLLWASTSAKDPTFSPVKYVEELIAPGTINTMPRETLETYRGSGRPQLRLPGHLARGADVRAGLKRLGIDLGEVAQQLEAEGITRFVEPFDRLQSWLEARRGDRAAQR